MTKAILSLSVLALSTLSSAKPITSRGQSQGGKRGVAFEVGKYTKYFSQFGPVTWMYNWNSDIPDAANDLEYVSMLHSDKPEHTDKWNQDIEDAIASGNTKHLLSFNEPDQCGGGGSCMQDVYATVEAHKHWVQPIWEQHKNIKIGAPAVTNGVKSENGTLMGAPYLTEFMNQCTDANGCHIDFVVAHWYDEGWNVEYFKKQMRDIHKAGKYKPVWITEFGLRSGDPAEFLRQVIPWLDDPEQSWIERYAFHYASPGVLVTADGNGLSPLGTTYATTK